MKLKDFLILKGVDISDTRSQAANIIKTGLFERNRLDLDFEMDVDKLTDNEVHDVFYSWLLEGRSGLPAYSHYDIVKRMRDEFEKFK